jgi:hypothetical protein
MYGIRTGLDQRWQRCSCGPERDITRYPQVKYQSLPLGGRSLEHLCATGFTWSRARWGGSFPRLTGRVSRGMQPYQAWRWLGHLGQVGLVRFFDKVTHAADALQHMPA